MRTLIVFATTDGHTRKLANFIAARLAAAGHDLRLCDAAETIVPDPAGFDAAVLAASVHMGQYQSAFRRFARKKHAALNAMPTAFISVSLSAAGDDPGDLAGLAACAKRLERQTSWRPTTICHAAGAMPFTAYNPIIKLVMKSIARRRGQLVETSEDYDFTDYASLGEFVDAFMASVEPSTRQDRLVAA